MTPDSEVTPDTAHQNAAHERLATMVNRRGLHARAAAKFVNAANQFTSEITVTRDGESVSGRSIMGLLMLAVACGDSILIAADGPDAGAALAALMTLVESKFDED